MTRAEEIAKADAEIIEAARFVNETAVGAHIDEYTEGLRRLQAAFKARAALDEPTKPRLRTAKEFTRSIPPGCGWLSVVETRDHEIAEIMRRLKSDGRAYVDVYNEILDALEGRVSA